MSDKVIYRASDGVAEVRMNRPEKKNAILGEMYAAMADAILAAEADAFVRALVIGGEGGAFTAGNDLTYAHYPDLPHGIIQMTMHSDACLAATEEVARLLAQKLAVAK